MKQRVRSRLFDVAARSRVIYIILSFIRLLVDLVRNRSLPTVLFAPPGHYYSPLANLRQYQHPRDPLVVEGIELNVPNQLELARRLSRHNFEPRRWIDNNVFAKNDARVLFAMLREFLPSQVIEVGSGYSSAVILDSEIGVGLMCIEPHPWRLQSLMLEGDDLTLLTKGLESVPQDVFASLGNGDFLFIDSTHVMKVNSDVHHVIFDILPCLTPGVIVHIHDIFWPFEYPESWIREGRSWNEVYAVRALLMNNPAWEILFFSSYLERFHPEALVPITGDLSGPGSLWLRKKASARASDLA